MRKERFKTVRKLTGTRGYLRDFKSGEIRGQRPGRHTLNINKLLFPTYSSSEIVRTRPSNSDRTRFASGIASNETDEAYLEGGVLGGRAGDALVPPSRRRPFPLRALFVRKTTFLKNVECKRVQIRRKNDYSKGLRHN